MKANKYIFNSIFTRIPLALLLGALLISPAAAASEKDPRFGDMAKDILGLVFNYLNLPALHRCAQVNRNWQEAVKKFDNEYEKVFKSRFPKLYAKYEKKNHLKNVKDWRDELYWATQFADHCCSDLEEFASSEWKWAEEYAKFARGFDLFGHAKLRLLLGGKDIAALEAFIKEHDDDPDFNIEHWLENQETWRFLDPNRPSYAPEINQRLFQWLKDKVPNKNTLLYWAIATHQEESVCNLLIDKHFWSLDMDKKTCLLNAAVRTGRLGLVKRLLEIGIYTGLEDYIQSEDFQNRADDVVHNDDSPLEAAFGFGRHAIARLLIENGAQLNREEDEISFEMDVPDIANVNSLKRSREDEGEESAQAQKRRTRNILTAGIIRENRGLGLAEINDLVDEIMADPPPKPADDLNNPPMDPDPIISNIQKAFGGLFD